MRRDDFWAGIPPVWLQSLPTGFKALVSPLLEKVIEAGVSPEETFVTLRLVMIDWDGSGSFLSFENFGKGQFRQRHWHQCLEHHPFFRRLILSLCERLSRSQGSTCLRMDERGLVPLLTQCGVPSPVLAFVLRLLCAHVWRDPPFFNPGAAERDVPFVVIQMAGIPCVFSQKLYRSESMILERVCAQFPPKLIWSKEQVADGLKAIVEKQPLTIVGEGGTPQLLQLADMQRNALGIAPFVKTLVVTGGPGTGKTTVIASLLRLFVRLGIAPERMTLTAPTGMAAKRMHQAVNAALQPFSGDNGPDGLLLQQLPTPKTIHLLLGYSPKVGGFSRGPDRPLSSDLIILDEASMVDVRLAESLFAALKRDARLVLLGDADQLPSVDPGAVLQQLTQLKVTAAVPEGEGPFFQNDRVWTSFQVVKLARSHRQRTDDDGRQIVAFAQWVQGVGTLDHGTSSLPQPWRRLSDLAAWESRGVGLWSPSDLENDIAALVRYVANRQFLPLMEQVCNPFSSAVLQRGSLSSIFAAFHRMKLLCLTNAGPLGVDRLNEMFRSVLAQEAHFFAGQPVMMTKNDYRRRIFNGDLGLVLPFRQAEESEVQLRAVFPFGDEFRAFSVSSLPHLVPAFAMTVHKSQGSEFDHVHLVLPNSDGPLLRKDLIYTAVTRAKQSVLICGSDQLLKVGAEKAIARFSGLRHRFELCMDASSPGIM